MVKMVTKNLPIKVAKKGLKCIHNKKLMKFFKTIVIKKKKGVLLLFFIKDLQLGELKLRFMKI